MATTNIELDIENITGVSDADDQFIKTAQKFVVSRIPKELLLWAGTSTAVGSHGGDSSPTAITLPQPTDNIIDVQRNGFSANQVPESMQGFIANSASLHLATETFPKYYIQAGNKVIVKPNPSDSETALVNYVDFLKIDDDCDLRGAVIFHAVAQEFEKLATSKVSDWSDLTIPVAPSSPSFSSDLNVAAVAPSTPSLTTISFTSIDSAVDATASVFSTASVNAGNVFTGSEPLYSKPIKQSQVAFADYWEVGDFGDNDPGTLSISATSPPAPPKASITSPGVSTITVSALGTAPEYVAPVMGIPDFSDANTWINTEEDPEMLSSRIHVINAQISEFGSKVQSALNDFNEENTVYQADLQHKVQQAQIDAQEAQKEGDMTLQASVQDFSQELSLFSAKVQQYQADVTTEVQQYTQNLSRYQLELNTVYTAWAKTESDNIALFQSDIQNELNNFNKDNAAFQAQVQESMQEIQVSNQVNISKAQSDLQVAIANADRSQERQLQNAIQDMQAITADNGSKMSKFQGEINQYQANISKEVEQYSQSLAKKAKEYESKLGLYNADLQKYQAEVAEKSQKITSSTQNAAYYSNEAKKYYEWSINEVQMYTQNNSKMINRTMAAQAAQQQRG